MEVPESDWEIREGYDDDDDDDDGGWEESVKMGWVLDKGLTLGKRILVTGFVMTSAPIVLPPVLVISAIGFVCSLPYGFFLASYACTEKLMSQLLPVATASVGHGDTVARSPHLLGHGVHDDVDVGSTYRQRGFSRGEKPLFRALDFDAEENEPTGETDEGDGKKAGMEGMLGGADDVIGVLINIEGDEQAPFEVTSISIDVSEAPTGYKEDKMVEETGGLIEKMRDEGIAGGEVVDEKQFGSDKNVNEGAHGTGTEGPLATAAQNVEQNGKKVSKKKQEEKKSHGATGNKSRKGKAKGGKQVEGKKEKEVSGAGEATTTPADSEEKGGKVVSSCAVHQMADPLKVAISPGGYDERQTEITPAESLSASDKDLYSEEEIWKHIDSMRKIVGYTTPRHETCMEELQALYIFAGVEPPTSFKDLSDLVEINHKLRFLMSIVGVK